MGNRPERLAVSNLIDGQSVEEVGHCGHLLGRSGSILDPCTVISDQTQSGPMSVVVDRYD